MASSILLVLFSTTLSLADRVALVVGNSEYERVQRLSNPVNDAMDVGASLERIGFEVTTLLNANRNELNQSLRAFARKARGSEMAVVYFAGHGIEIDNSNYLLPVDADIQDPLDVAFEGVEMSQFLKVVEGAETLKLVLLDACRDNPFLVMASDGTRSLRRGLTRVEPPGGVLVGYAARGGTVAYDGDGRNSPYANALIQNLETPGLEIGKLFRLVRDRVFTDTRGKQEPFTYGSLPATDIYLVAAKPNNNTANDVLRDFAQADLTGSITAWREFITRYDSDPRHLTVVNRAREKMSALQSPNPQGAERSQEVSTINSSLIMACDANAADPEDTNRPDGIPGIKDDELKSDIAITACRIAVSGHPNDARSIYNLSRAYFASGERALGIAAMRKAVDLQYTIALDKLGNVLIESADEMDVAEGIDLLSGKSQNGDVQAAMLLAAYFAEGKAGVPGANELALGYYSTAAEAGNLNAMYEAGYRLVSNTLSSESELQQGLDWLELAAADGNEQAMLRLSNLYFLNETFADRARGINWLEGAATIGNEFAQRRLVSIATQGESADRDPELASRWLQALADGGDQRAAVETGFNYEIGRGFEPDPQKSAHYYFKALRMGSQLPLQRRASDWSNETARELQAVLAATWFYRGIIDGIIGGKTIQSMRDACGCDVPRRDTRFDIEFSRR